MHHVLVAFACAASALGAQMRPPASAVPALDSVRLLSDLAVLAADSMEGRRMGTPGGGRARTFLLGAFARIGLQPAPGGFAMPFGAKSRAAADVAGVNLVGLVRGTVRADRYIVVSAHYDHLGVRNGEVFNGTDDNASGASALLAIAAWARTHPPQNSLIFAWFDGEESGELGARAFLDHPPVPLVEIVADVNLDMVSRNVRGELYAAGTAPWPVMRPFVDSVERVALVTLRRGHDSGAGQDNWIHQSDQGPFHDHRIPFVYFGVEDHPDYHKPTDDIGRIDPGFFFRSARTIAEFVRRLDHSLDPVAAARVAASAGPKAP